MIRPPLPTPWVFPYPDREMYSKEQMHAYADDCVAQVTAERDADAERYRCLCDAVTAMMAPLGYHGTISARDDRVQAVMDALSKLDASRKA